MEIVANSDVKVEVKPVNFDDLPPAILKNCLTKIKKLLIMMHLDMNNLILLLKF